jgi:hypothetical protein
MRCLAQRLELYFWSGSVLVLVASGCVLVGNQGVNLIGFIEKKKDMMEAHVN